MTPRVGLDFEFHRFLWFTLFVEASSRRVCVSLFVINVMMCIVERAITSRLKRRVVSFFCVDARTHER